jgi:hypothetical protein
MMRRECGRVLIDISEDDFTNLLMLLGFAWTAADARSGGPIDGDFVLRLANAINESNPDWTPYDVTS